MYHDDTVSPNIPFRASPQTHTRPTRNSQCGIPCRLGYVIKAGLPLYVIDCVTPYSFLFWLSKAKLVVLDLLCAIFQGGVIANGLNKEVDLSGHCNMSLEDPFFVVKEWVFGVIGDQTVRCGKSRAFTCTTLQYYISSTVRTYISRQSSQGSQARLGFEFWHLYCSGLLLAWPSAWPGRCQESESSVVFLLLVLLSAQKSSSFCSWQLYLSFCGISQTKNFRGKFLLRLNECLSVTVLTHSCLFLSCTVQSVVECSVDNIRIGQKLYQFTVTLL